MKANSAKVTKFIKEILDHSNERKVFRVASPAYPDPLAVFKNLLDQRGRELGIGTTAGNTNSNLFTPVLGDSYFSDLKAGNDLHGYLVARLQEPIELSNVLDRLHGVLNYVKTYLQENSIDGESVFYALVLAFFYVYGQSMDLSCIPSLKEDLKEYTTHCHKLPEDCAAAYHDKIIIDVLPDLDNPDKREAALGRLSNVKKLPRALVPSVLSKLRELLELDNSLISKYVYVVFCNGVLPIAKEYIGAVITNALRILSPDKNLPEWNACRSTVCEGICNLPIPVDYRPQVTEALLALIDSGYLGEFACKALGKLEIPKELLPKVIQRLTTACGNPQLLANAAISLDKLRVSEDIKRENISKLLRQVTNRTVDLSALRALSLISIPEDLKDTVRIVVIDMANSEGQVDEEPLYYALDEKLPKLEKVCQVLENIVPKSDDLLQICGKMLIEVKKSRESVREEYTKSLCKINHEITFQHKLLEFLIVYYPEALPGCVADLFPRLDPRCQAAVLSYFTQQASRSTQKQRVVYIGHNEKPTVEEILTLRSEAESCLRLLPQEILAEAAGYHYP